MEKPVTPEDVVNVFKSLSEEEQIRLLDQIIGYTHAKYGLPEIEEPIHEAMAEL